MSVPIVNKFTIIGLFGKKDIEIDMSGACCILIGENGLGKTTILSIINYVLSCQFQKLTGYNFSQINIVIGDAEFSFAKDEIESFAMACRYHSEDFEISSLPDFIKSLKDIVLDKISSEYISEILGRRPSLRRKLGNIRLDTLDNLTDFIKNFLNLFRFMQLCAKLNFEVEYLPKYRRIEADLHKILDDYRNSRTAKERVYRNSLFTEDENADIVEHFLKDKSSIQFGMTDIEDMLNTFIRRISESSVMGFSKVSGGMISKLVERDFTVRNTEFNKSEVEIVLQRSGRNLSSEEKRTILEIIDNREIYNNKYLVYFLSQLIDVYKSQRVFDSALKGFVSACNEFLVDKKFYYNESHLKIGLYYINDAKHTREISLNNLSSGEKQLVSIMAKVYLKLSSDVILLIDEPELSLSMRWQKKFLPTLLKAEKCRQIIAVTHSPFIFSNELEDNAIGSLEYVRYGE